MKLEKQLAEYIRQGNRDAYRATRYPEIGDAEELLFVGEDFSGVDLSRFPLDFNVFRNCILDGAVLLGYPIAIESSSARNLIIPASFTIIEARDTDFRGLKYDPHTRLANLENRAVSRFYNCQFDPHTKKHFARQGVEFTDAHRFGQDKLSSLH